MGTSADFLGTALGRLVQASWQAAALAGIVLLVCLVLRDRLSGRWRSALWLVVLVRLFMPAAPESSLSLFNLLAGAGPAESPGGFDHQRVASEPDYPAVSRFETVSVESTPVSDQPSVERPRESRAGPTTSISIASRPPRSRWTLLPWQIVGVVWFAGVLVVSGRVAISMIRLCRTLRRCRPVTDPRVTALFDASSSEMRLSGRVRLLASAEPVGPAVTGLFRARLIVPDGLLALLSGEELRLIFLHELAHVRRHDVAVAWLWTVAGALHWFNPVVWFVGLRARTDRELACDEAVLARLDRPGRRQYGRTLLNVVQSLSSLRPIPGAVGVLARESVLTRRIVMIAKYRRGSRLWTLPAAGLLFLLALVGLTGAVGSAPPPVPQTPEPGQAALLGPIDVVASPDGKTLYVAAADGGRIVVVDAAGGKVSRSIAMPAQPTGLVLSPDGATLYVTCAAPEGTVAVVDVESGKVGQSIAVGHWPIGPAISPNGKTLYVCNRFDNNLAAIDLAAERIVLTPVTREPYAAAVTPDGKSVFVINHLPLDRADAYDVAAVVTVIDTATHRTETIRLVNGSTNLRGICVSPDGKYVYVTHILARYQMPTTRLERGWMNTNVISVIDGAEKKLINTVLLDDIDVGAANPWGVAVTDDGKSICVTHAGTHELSVIDADAMFEKLGKLPPNEEAAKANPELYGDRGAYSSFTREDVPNDLAFLRGIRRRICLPSEDPWAPVEVNAKLNSPRGLAIVGAKVYIAACYSDALAVVNLESTARRDVSTIQLGPLPELTVARRGEMFFNDASHCFQHWQSCASCHPDARVDALNWDLLNDGMGNPKNVRSMLLAHQTPPSMSSGVLSDGPAAVRSDFMHLLFAPLPEEREEVAAIDKYLESLKPIPSPYLVDGQLSPAARRGKKLFFDAEINCASCHPEPLFTDMQMRDVGSKGQYDRRDTFDTPTLIECWRTAPYMHDGRYTTMQELFITGKHGNQSGEIDNLSRRQINDLVEYVLSL